jgi:hypothetical protein
MCGEKQRQRHFVHLKRHTPYTRGTQLSGKPAIQEK